MRIFALILIAISEILILLLLNADPSATNLTLISTLTVVVIVAFASSALLRKFKKLKPVRNYMISGIIGVVVGLIYYLWASVNLESFVAWLMNTGIYFLFVIIFIAALYLFLYREKDSSAIQN